MDFTSDWPDWGDTGSKPNDGKDYAAGDNVSAPALDYLWYTIKATFSSVETELSNVKSTAESKADDPHGDGAHDSTVPSQSALDSVSADVSTNANDIDSLETAAAGKSDDTHDHTGTEPKVPDSGLIEDYVKNSETNYYTDSEAVSAVDGKVDNAATSVAALDDQVANNVSSISSIQNDNTTIIEPRTSDPSSPEDGRAWIRTDL